MANGPFGNPLSTGIALNFEVDMTPYRQMHARKMKKLEDEKKEKKRKAKELAGILSKVTLDEDKIFWRNHDDARIKYADTIDKVQTMYNNEDYSGMYKAMNDFNMDMSNYIQSNNQIKARSTQIQKGGIYYDPALEAMQNDRDVSDVDYARALEEAGYGDISENGIYSYVPLQDIINVDELYQKGFKGIDKTVFDAMGQKTVLGRQDQTRFLQTQIPEDVYMTKKEEIKQSIKSNPQRAIAFLRANGKDVKSLAGMSQADQTAQTDLWLEEIVGGAGEKFRYGEEKVSIPTPKADPAKFKWSASGGNNEMWGWRLTEGGKINIKDAGGSLDIDKSLKLNRFKGGVAENEFTVGTNALQLDPAGGGGQGAFVNANMPANTTIKGTPTAVTEVGGKKYVEMVSRNILDFAKRDRMLRLEDEKSKRNLSQSEIDELQELQKAETKVTYLVPYSQSIEAQLYNSMGITGNQVDQMNSYFNAGGASGSATMTQAQWNAAWAALSPGQTMVGLDGNTYIKQ